jgi:RNA polymerase sigma-70 factor (ECF subfamily)
VTAEKRANGRQNSLEVLLIERIESRGIGTREFQDHEPRAGRQNSAHFGERSIQAGDVSDSKRDNSAGHRSGWERQLDRIRCDRRNPRASNLVTPLSQHRLGEIGAHDRAAEVFCTADHYADVHRSRAQVEVRSFGIALESELANRLATPDAIDVEAQDVIEEVVPRRDLGEYLPHVGTLLRAASRRPDSGGVVSRYSHSRKVDGRQAQGQANFETAMLPPPVSAREQIAKLSDAEVVALAQKGKEPAYRELLARYERPVFSLIFRMVRDRETAEDLAQETFIKVLNNIDRYSPDFKFSSWLFKIANNLTIDHLRRRRVDTISIEGAPDAVTAESAKATSIAIASGDESPLAELESRELGQAIEHAIGRLRPEYRACIMLRHVEDRSYEEIAEIVKLPLGTVKTYIHRARHELRAALEEVR